MSDGKSHGWFRIANDLVDSGTLARIPSVAAKVFLVLNRYANEGLAWPSLETIARLAGINRGSVSRAVGILTAFGLIERVTHGLGRGHSNVYSIPVKRCASATFPTPPNVAPAQLNRRASAIEMLRQRGAIKTKDKDYDKDNAARCARPRRNSGDHQILIDHFCAAWKARYGTDYPFRAAAGKNAKAIQALRQTIPDVAQATGIIDRYLHSDDAWIIRNRHDLGILRSKLAMFVTAGNANANGSDESGGEGPDTTGEPARNPTPEEEALLRMPPQPGEPYGPDMVVSIFDPDREAKIDRNMKIWRQGKWLGPQSAELAPVALAADGDNAGST